MSDEQKIDIKALLIERLNLALGHLSQGSEGYRRVWAIRQIFLQMRDEDQVLVPVDSLYYFTKWAPTHGDQYNTINFSIADCVVSNRQPGDDEKLCRYDAIIKVFAEQRPDTDEETRHKAFEAAWKVLGAATVKGVEEKCAIGADGGPCGTCERGELFREAVKAFYPYASEKEIQEACLDLHYTLDPGARRLKELDQMNSVLNQKI